LAKSYKRFRFQSHEQMEHYKQEAKKWREYNRELLKRLFTNDSLEREYRSGGVGVLTFDEASAFREFRENIDWDIQNLESIAARLELIPEPTARPDPTPATRSSTLDVTKVFVVQGHDGAPKAEVARFVERLGFEAIILHERPNKGRPLITKFREEAAGVGFAVVLMTPDDAGKAKDAADLNVRARQNVVFELGFFIGKLGPERVAALIKGDIELPSDYDGVVYISLDREDWQSKLGTELQDAGYNFDWNRVMRR
jgi:predicted nucleotide-binding protein